MTFSPTERFPAFVQITLNSWPKRICTFFHFPVSWPARKPLFAELIFSFEIMLLNELSLNHPFDFLRALILLPYIMADVSLIGTIEVVLFLDGSWWMVRISPARQLHNPNLWAMSQSRTKCVPRAIPAIPWFISSITACIFRPRSLHHVADLSWETAQNNSSQGSDFRLSFP